MKTVVITCMAPDAKQGEEARASLFATCQDLGITVLYSDVRKSTEQEVADARNMGIEIP